MPLIVITGLPSSGKSYRAQQIFADFQSRVSSSSSTLPAKNQSNLSVQYIPSCHASLDSFDLATEQSKVRDPSTNPRDLIFNSAREEKTARAEEFSSTKRALSKSNIVITDAPNYIKGFRYQMWCEAKAVGTRSVVVHVAARENECKAWNDSRIRVHGWEDIFRAREENSNAVVSPRIGKDVRGELQPESHTAIYGDRAVNDEVSISPRSRTSSMGGASEDDGPDRNLAADTMTLKSLYISDQKLESRPNGLNVSHSEVEPSVTPTVAPTTAPADPPAPETSLPYSPTTLESLSMRYEPPSPFTRWDTPLFTIPSSDIHPPYQAIWEALFPPPVKPTKKVLSQLRPGETVETKAEEVRRHAATVLPKATGAESLQILESATADVVKILLATARECGMADGEGGKLTLSVPEPKSGVDIHVSVVVPLNTALTQPALQRLRRKYTQIQRGGIAHGQGYVNGRVEIVKDFSKFVEAEWNID